MTEKLTSIIIPVYNQLQYTRRCLLSIQKFTSPKYELVVVNNHSTDGTAEYLQDWQGDITIIQNKSNLGFAIACNQGIKAAKGDYLLLLNNDVYVTPNWLNNLIICLENGKNAGLVGPVTNYASSLQRLSKRFKGVDDMLSFTQRFNQQNSEKWFCVQKLIGFCLLFNRSLVDKIGYLDEKFQIGGMEDDDYCLRAILAGYKLYCAGDTFVYHFGSATFKGQGMNITEIMKKNQKHFITKWPNDLFLM